MTKSWTLQNSAPPFSFLLRHAPCGQVKLLIVAQGCFDFCCPRPALRLWEVSCLCSPCWSIIFFDVLLKIHLFQKDRWSKRGRKLEGLLIKAHFPKSSKDRDAHGPATMPRTFSGSGTFLVLQVSLGYMGQNNEKLIEPTGLGAPGANVEYSTVWG